MSVRILLVDDHAVVRQGIRSLLEDGERWKIFYEASNGQEAVEKAIRLNPDLILMDISMPVMNGIEAIRQIHGRLPNTKIVVLTMHDSPQMAEQARHAGASACLLKSDSPENLRHAIAAVLRPATTSPASVLPFSLS